MKKLIFAFALVLLAGVTFGQKKIDIEKEKEAIIKVVQEEGDAFNDRDFDRFVETFVHNETASRLQATKNSYSYYVGWEEMRPLYKDYFENNPEPNTAKRIRTNYKIKVYKEIAWATFNEQNGPDGSMELKDILLEKVEGEWKIVSLTIIGISSYEDEIEEGDE